MAFPVSNVSCVTKCSEYSTSHKLCKMGRLKDYIFLLIEQVYMYTTTYLLPFLGAAEDMYMEVVDISVQWFAHFQSTAVVGTN